MDTTPTGVTGSRYSREAIMANESQENFLIRIRKALANRGEPIKQPHDLEIARVVGSDQNPIELFTNHLNESGAHVHRVADEAKMVEKIVDILTSADARSVIIPSGDLPSHEKIIERLKANGVNSLNPDDQEAYFEAEAGITGVACAIAESGSMSVTSGSSRRPLASLAPPVHIGIVRAEHIIPDLLDWSVTESPNMPANEVLVSGPSKTADIEMTLVPGGHGPGTLYVIIVG